MAEQRLFVSRVRADDENRIRFFDVGERHFKRRAGNAVGEIRRAQSVIDTVTAKRAHDFCEQVPLFARRQRSNERTEIGTGFLQTFGDERDRA